MCRPIVRVFLTPVRKLDAKYVYYHQVIELESQNGSWTIRMNHSTTEFLQKLDPTKIDFLEKQRKYLEVTFYGRESFCYVHHHLGANLIRILICFVFSLRANSFSSIIDLVFQSISSLVVGIIKAQMSGSVYSIGLSTILYI